MNLVGTGSNPVSGTYERKYMLSDVRVFGKFTNSGAPNWHAFKYYFTCDKCQVKWRHNDTLSPCWSCGDKISTFKVAIIS